jgi:DNA replication protein DnaC
MMLKEPTMNGLDALRARAEALRLHGLLAHWHDVSPEIWACYQTLIEWEEEERARRTLEYRLKAAQLGRFKPICDFDWKWPKRIDRAIIEAQLSLEFIKEAGNVIFVGSAGVGKTMFAKNIAHHALLHGHSVLFATAGEMLGRLAELDSDSALRRRLRHYTAPRLLVIDEVGSLSYSNRHADLLFEIVSRRYEHRSTIVTTNRPFAEWNELFPNAACVVSMVDRLVHHAEVIRIEGDSYRLEEARKKTEKRIRQRTEQRANRHGAKS